MKNIHLILFSLFTLLTYQLQGQNVGIGTLAPLGKLHIFMNSGTSNPQLRITEDQFDFARIKFDNSIHLNTFWDIAALADTALSTSKINFYYSGPNGSGDRMTILGNGNVGIGTTNPTAKLHVFGESKLGGRVHIFNTGGSVFVGSGAGQNDDFTSNANTAIGDFALSSNQTGVSNVALGANALQFSNGSVDNVGIGRNSMLNKTSGNFNVGIGHSSLLNNLTGSGNVAIGYLAGLNETGSNKLYIDNSSTTAPLIYGDFSTNLLRTNGKQEVTGDLEVAGNSFFVDQSLAYVGIGTTAPSAPLHVKDIGFTYALIEASSGNDPILSLKNTSEGHSSTQWSLRMDASAGNRMQWRYADANKMVLTTGGDLALGTTVPAVGYKLSVDGKMIAEELRIKVSTAWPDYVFDDNYHLQSLEDLESDIFTNGHLPGIPKAEVIEKQGLDTGEMQIKMMEKIEELTLYVIDLNKRIKELELENRMLKK